MKKALSFLVFIGSVCISSAGYSQINEVGMNTHIPPADAIDAVNDMGCKWIRIDNNWDSVETSKGNFNWGELDRVVNDAVARKIKVFMTVAYSPAWASRGDGRGDGSYNDVPTDNHYAEYLSAVVNRYKDRVKHYGLWNEANLDGFWEGNADEYVDIIVNPGYDAIHNACGDCKALGPELAHVGGYDSWMNKILSRAKNKFDIISHHIYQKFEENGQTIWDGDSFLNALETPRFGGIGQRESLYPLLQKYYSDKEVWITETGYRCEDQSADEFEQQRIFVRRVLEEQEKRSWWTNSFFYEIEDCGVAQPECNIDGYGILRRLQAHNQDDTFHDNFLFKPSYCEIKSFIASRGWGVPFTPECPPMASEPTDAGVSDAGDIDGGGVDTGDDDDADTGDVEIGDAGGGGDASDDLDSGIKDVCDRELPTPPNPANPSYNAVRTKEAIKIDGDLSEWAAVRGENILPDWYLALNEKSLGPQDLSASFMITWDDEALYFAFIVNDDIEGDSYPDDLMWMGDSVQIAIDGDYDRTECAYDGDSDYEYTIGNDGRHFRHFFASGTSDAPEIFVKREDGLYTYEIKLPYDDIDPVHSKSGFRFGLSLLVNDNDKSGRAGWIQWASGVGFVKNPIEFGTVTLVESESSGNDDDDDDVLTDDDDDIGDDDDNDADMGDDDTLPGDDDGDEEICEDCCKTNADCRIGYVCSESRCESQTAMGGDDEEGEDLSGKEETSGGETDKGGCGCRIR